jgi:hypothetical protein
MTGKRSTQVSVTILATLALTLVPALSACRTSRPAEALHCVDSENRVVDEANCQQKDRAGGTGFFPYFWYYGGGRGLPMGSTVTGGGYEPQSGRSYTSPSGTQRGGFGSSVGDGGSSGS